jgi:hypothetical protein
MLATSQTRSALLLLRSALRCAREFTHDWDDGTIRFEIHCG